MVLRGPIISRHCKLPPIFALKRVVSGQIPLPGSIVLHLDASTLAGSGPLSLWPDSSGLGNNASQTTESLQPTIIPMNRYCSAAVQLRQDYLTIPDAPSLNPDTVVCTLDLWGAPRFSIVNLYICLFLELCLPGRTPFSIATLRFRAGLHLGDRVQRSFVS